MILEIFVSHLSPNSVTNPDMPEHTIKFDKLQNSDLQTIYQLTELLSRIGDEQNMLQHLLDQLMAHTGS